MYLIQSLRRGKRLVKTMGNLSQNVNDFAAILYENSKIACFDLKVLVAGPTFYELKTFLFNVNSDTKLK